MAVFGRGKPPKRRPAIVASATKLDLRDPKESKRHKSRAQKWQSDAWNYYDNVGEIWFAHRFIGNSISRVRLFIGIRDDPQQAPAPAARMEEDAEPDAEPVYVDKFAEMAAGELDRLRASDGGHAELLRDLAMNLSVAGDGYLLATEIPAPPVTDRPTVETPESEPSETWEVLSIDELKVLEEGSATKEPKYGRLVAPPKDGRTPSANDFEEISNDAFVLRIFRRHPRWSHLADSAMRAVLDECEELEIIGRSARSAARSRIAGAGVLLVPDELDFEGDDETVDPNDDAESSSFNKKLRDAMTTPIADEGNASAVVPVTVRGPAEYLKEFRHVTFERPMDATAIERAEKLIRRIAQGLDLPAEVLTGVAEVNHWTAWQIDEQTFKAHIEPVVQLICDALTVGFIRTAMLVAGAPDPDRYVVWYDPSALVVHPDRGQKATDGLNNNALSWAAWRRYNGFTDDDAPDDEELEKRLAVNKAILTADLAAELLRRAGISPGLVLPDATPVNGEEPTEQPPAPAETEETEGPPAGGETPAPPEEQAAAVIDVAALIAAASRPALDRLGSRLVEIDRTLRASIVTAADMAVNRAIERAGNRTRTLAQRRNNRQMRELVRDVDARLVCATLGRDLCGRLGAYAEDLVDDSAFDALRARWYELIDRGQRSALTAVGSALGANIDDLDDVSTQQRHDRDAGWALLLGALLTLARSRLFDTSTPSAPGEADLTVSVPAGVVRDALIRAGGSEGVLVEAGTQPAGGVATGSTVREVLRNEGVVQSGFVWHYGPAMLRTANFEAHEDLDGVEFADWSDPALAVRDVDAWIGASFYFPGDHAGCQCDFEPQFSSTNDLASGE